MEAEQIAMGVPGEETFDGEGVKGFESDDALRGAVSFHLRVHAGFELTQRRRTTEDADAARGAVLTTVRVDVQQRADFLPARVLHRV
ncbi:MAG TPA: hypothetical protein VEU33_49750 [Archangium sp.]|nr:hypothetical protein [Archangium sp.]